MTDSRTTELQSLSKLKTAGRLHYWRGTIEIPESELHAICDEIQAEHDQAIAATLDVGECEIVTTEGWLPVERYHRCKICGAFFAVNACPNCGRW